MTCAPTICTNGDEVAYEALIRTNDSCLKSYMPLWCESSLSPVPCNDMTENHYVLRLARWMKTCSFNVLVVVGFERPSKLFIWEVTRALRDPGFIRALVWAMTPLSSIGMFAVGSKVFSLMLEKCECIVLLLLWLISALEFEVVVACLEIQGFSTLIATWVVAKFIWIQSFLVNTHRRRCF